MGGFEIFGELVFDGVEIGVAGPQGMKPVPANAAR